MQVTTLGIDLAKNVFCVHGCDANGKPVLRKQLSRRQLLSFIANLPRCLVAMEACASAHYWAPLAARFAPGIARRPSWSGSAPAAGGRTAPAGDSPAPTGTRSRRHRNWAGETSQSAPSLTGPTSLAWSPRS